jgi:hypothetical protein
MPVSISGTNGVTFPDSSLQAAAASPYVNKNRLINGEMRIDQRNAGASVTIGANTATYTLDRWRAYATQASKMSFQQSTDAPTGFVNSLKITSLSAYSVLSSDLFNVTQTIEGYNIADFGWGTANAKTVTLSFWVKSSLTGTFSGAFNGQNNRCYAFTYTISSANTWEQKTITVTGDTSGTWGTGNSYGIYLTWSLGAGSTYLISANSWQTADIIGATGSTSVVGTNGATWYVTGVQLEIGSSATPFERRLYNQELANCQRYFWKLSAEGFGLAVNGYSAGGRLSNPVPMRAAGTISGATFSVNGGSAGSVASEYQTITGQTIYNGSNNWTTNSTVTISGSISAEL